GVRFEQHATAVQDGCLNGGPALLLRLVLFLRLLHIGGQRLAAVEEGGLEVADANLVVVLQQAALGDFFIVDEGLVATLHILNEEIRADPQDEGMFSTDGGNGNDNVTIGVAAKDHAILGQRNLAGRSTLDDLERSCHRTLTSGGGSAERRSAEHTLPVLSTLTTRVFYRRRSDRA